MSGAVYPLAGNQQHAVDPEESVWLSASAGTGKTQVLSARVLRLLLQPRVDPSDILCLTFTKAGAAEMAVRINDVLARWVRLEDTLLSQELAHLGAPTDPDTREKARTLFASVLDCPGGGLRIDTIHAFSQWLLANFPQEAGLQPGMRPIEDREREILARDVLADMLVDAERASDAQTLDAVAEFTRRKGADALRGWLMRCASHEDLWFGQSAWQAPMRAQVMQLLGLPVDADENWVAEALSPEVFPDETLRAMLPTLQGWNAKNGQNSAEFIGVWLAADLTARGDLLEQFYDTILKKDGLPRVMKKPCDTDPNFANYQDRIAEGVAEVAERKRLIELSGFLTPALELARHFAISWRDAKQREGLLDFDDLIAMAAKLLSQKDSAAWIRYKLDRQFDHILVDEAQDTNASQWTIILDGLIDDFFAGEGARDDRVRTIFTVGDYKQAIFGFQGTSPENFEAAKRRVKAMMAGAAENAGNLRGGKKPSELKDMDLARSFRTTQPVLDFVDAAIAAIGSETLGLSTPAERHQGFDKAGLVTLWEPVRSDAGDDPETSRDEGEISQDSWLARHDRKLADKIAEQVHRWLNDEPFILEKGTPRRATAGDIMVLVRKRKELASLIVGRLHARGVPVAGVDRLRLGAPLAVKDVLAALRFASQPLDDLSLANLLSSPLIGWSQDDLLEHVPRKPKQRLWDHLRASEDPKVEQTVAQLRELLARADFDTPQALIAWLLTGPWQGRARLIARLGREANDPLDELLNASFAYEATATPSLAGFIQWFDAGDGELKRDPGGDADQVRVMTVHGSKGLQAPIVILADATGSPGQGSDIALPERLPEALSGRSEPRQIPIPGLSKAERAGPVEEAFERATIEDMKEHWRLLYVAMTRAEEALFIGGSLGPRNKEGPPEDSWYARLAPLFGEEALSYDIWGARRERGYRAEWMPSDDAVEAEQTTEPELPAWLRKPIGPEPRPPKPLAPSSAGEEAGADPPLRPADAKIAARRGVILHRLLERLPDVAVAEREAKAAAWLAQQAWDLSEAERADILASALSVIATPEFAEIFVPGSLAEVPLAATVGGEVIAGIADRLLVTDEAVTVVDFKTTRRPPASEAEIARPILKQMAAYVAALEAIYPDRPVRAAVLYTHAPRLIALSDAALQPHKAAFVDSE
ncbi:double-strand break repair helicase AddA [Altererythrobacter lutimaris]|uniref:DNA 3'-5' helicase n=1 Tax=Altererythrobacter lutimaris TaxID=2743979 RepID=A0A850H385_9SPHN|nr:double-strand break repair helicase AddA [Altererythrobacter lutimaris]NVE93614.1 double-strand break repair helicase AddA [Altererythrobacter lutimaris]